jgi:hypothetical protein
MNTVWVLVIMGFMNGQPQAGPVGVYDTAKECQKVALEADKKMQENIKKGAPIDAYKLRCEGFKLGK